MEWYHYVMIGLGIIGFALQTVVLAITGTWALAKNKADIVAIISAHKESTALVMQQVRADYTVLYTSLDTRMHSFEKWARDEFVRRASFLNVINEARQQSAAQEAKYEKRFDTVDKKLDDLTTLIHEKQDKD